MTLIIFQINWSSSVYFVLKVDYWLLGLFHQIGSFGVLTNCWSPVALRLSPHELWVYWPIIDNDNVCLTMSEYHKKGFDEFVLFWFRVNGWMCNLLLYFHSSYLMLKFIVDVSITSWLDDSCEDNWLILK